jgi:hypothetical protein
MILNWVMLTTSRIEFPIICFVNLVLFFPVTSEHFASFHHICVVGYPSLHCVVSFSLQRYLNWYLPIADLLCKLRLLFASLSPQRPRFKSEFVCVGVSLEPVPSPGTSILPR